MNTPTTLVRSRCFAPARLKAARQAVGLLQREVAVMIRRDLRHYRRIESGDINPTAAQLGQFADLFGVTIDSLYAMPDEEESAA